MTPPAHPPAAAACPVCGSAEIAAVHQTTERMYGMGGHFDYRECGRCRSLAITEVPDDLARYYPPGYYSFATPAAAGGDGAVMQVARRWSTKVALVNPTTAAAVVAGGRRLGREVPAWVGLLAGLGLDFGATILDVGCGDGHRLRTLRRHGFTNLTGTDVHLPGPERPGQSGGGGPERPGQSGGGGPERPGQSGIELLATPLDALDGPYDVVMFHHSFEHMPDPMEVLATVQRILSPDGALVLRLPLAGCWAWRAYGSLWVQLDAPRHLFLPTPGGLHILAARAGFCVSRVAYDSDGFQFWGSEQYRQGRALFAEGPGTPTPPPYDAVQMQDLERQAAELNTRGDGDQAAFLLRRAG